MNVTFIGSRGVPARYGGFETCVEKVGSRMVARGHQVTVFCRRTHYTERPAEYLGMRLRYGSAIPEKHLETISHTALSALKLDRDTATVCMGVGNAPIVRLLELGGRRSILNVDGADWQREKWGKLASWYLFACERMAAATKGILVSDAEVVQRSYRQRFGRDSELIPYGADPPKDVGTSTLEQFGLKAGSYALFVGRLVPENGVLDILEGVRAAQLKIPLVVVGDASYSSQYIQHLHKVAPPSTVFTGYQFGGPYQQLSHHAALFILGARVGGTHPVLVEQMAAGNCILARDTESNREVLGDAGLIWRSVDELANALQSLCGDRARRREFSDAARARARFYDWDRVTDRYIDLCVRTLSPS